MRANELKQRWANGGGGIGLWLSLPEPAIAETIGTVGADYVVVDMQHGLIADGDVADLLRAMQRSTATPLVRVPWNDPGSIGRVLDAGAMGVIIPMVNTVEQAERAVSSCFYQPKGSRSHGPIRAATSLGPGYAEEANDQVLCIPMIETVQAIENLDAILEVPGIDAVYVGPADLSRTLGLPPAGDHDDASFIEALDTILAACGRAGVVAGVHANPAIVGKRLDQGFRMVTATSDLLAMMAGARAALHGDGDERLY